MARGQPDYAHMPPVGYCSRVLGSCPCCPAVAVVAAESGVGGSTCNFVEVPMGWNRSAVSQDSP